MNVASRTIATRIGRYIQGISTRSVDDLVKALGATFGWTFDMAMITILSYAAMIRSTVGRVEMSQTWAGRLARIGITLTGLLASTGIASADSPPSLAAFILQSFPYLLQSNQQPATASPDWCYQVELDPSENWWEFQPTTGDKQVHFYANRNAARIRLYYYGQSALTTHPSGKLDFSSLFLALDSGPGNAVYPLTLLTTLTKEKYTLLMEQKHGYKAAPWDPSQFPVNLPAGDPPACMDWPVFLDAWLSQQIYQLSGGQTDQATPVDDPYCAVTPDPNGTQPPCGTTPVQPVPIPNKLVAGAPRVVTDSPNVQFFSWNYNGRVHQIPYAVRILLQYSYPSGQGTMTNYVYLTIGYGGNGGAG